MNVRGKNSLRALKKEAISKRNPGEVGDVLKGSPTKKPSRTMLEEALLEKASGFSKDPQDDE